MKIVDKFNRPLKENDLVLQETYSVYADKLKYALVEDVKKGLLFTQFRLSDYGICEVGCNYPVFLIENPVSAELEIKNSLLYYADIRRSEIRRYEGNKRHLPIGSIVCNRKTLECWMYLGKAKSMQTLDENKNIVTYRDDFNSEIAPQYIFVSLDRNYLEDILINQKNYSYLYNYFNTKVSVYSFNTVMQPKAGCFLLDNRVDLTRFFINETTITLNILSSYYNNNNKQVSKVIELVR